MPEAHEDLVLFKRYDVGCVVHKSRIPIANRRFWLECACKIWIFGRTPGGDVVPPPIHRLTGHQEGSSFPASRAHELDSKTSGQYAIVLKRQQPSGVAGSPRSGRPGDRPQGYMRAEGAVQDREAELILAEALMLTGGRHGYSSQPAAFHVGDPTALW